MFNHYTFVNVYYSYYAYSRHTKTVNAHLNKKDKIEIC